MHMAHTARAAVLAVDLGSEFLKIAIVKPGRTPISIVLNEMCGPTACSALLRSLTLTSA